MRAVLFFFAALLGALPAAAQVAVNPITNKIYVANEFANSVTVIDGATGGTTTIPVGNRPQYIAANPLTNRIYVNNGADASLSVINGATNAVVTHPIGSTGPISINPLTNKVYIVRLSSEAFDEVTIFDGATENWYSIATQSFQPVAMAINPVTNILYVAHYANGHIRAIDGSSTDDHPPSVEIRIFDSAVAVAVNPVTNKIYALTEDSRSAISVIDGATNEATFLTPAGHAVGPKAVAVNPLTNKIYAAFAGEVIVIDGATNALTFIPSGSASAGPVAIGIDYTANKVYVPNANGTLTVIDGTTHAATSQAIPAGATGVAVNPVTHRVYISGASTTIVNGAVPTSPRDTPIDTTIDALAGDTAATNQSFTLRSSSSFSPGRPQLLRVYYQLDSVEGAWTAATGSGPYTASLTGLAPGTHTLRAFAVDSQVAPSTVTHPQNIPLIGDMASYTFSVGGTPPPASLAFAASSAAVTEGTSQVTLQVNRSGGSANAVTVQWTTANGSAQAGSDFGASGNNSAVTGTLSWAAGDTSSKPIVVPILDDGTVEAAESFTITLSSPTGGAVLGTPSSATVNVTDNDTSAEPVRLRFGAPSVSLAEADPNVTLQVLREGPATAPASVSYSTSNGSATAPSDYTATSGVITFNAGETSKWISIGRAFAAKPYVAIISDKLDEPTESFTITLASPSGGALATPSVATVTILGAPPAPATLQFSAASTSVSEGASSVTLAVVRSGETAGAASVDWSTSDGTAIAGSDFGVQGSASQLAGTLNWAAGETGAKSLNIPILNDSVAEGAKVFNVTLSGPVGASLGAASLARVTINDNDAGLAFESASHSVPESGGLVTLRVNRTGQAATAAQVVWAAVDGTAVVGRDYGAIGKGSTGTLYWAAGDATPKSFSIRILNDTLSEGDLAFTVELRSPSGAPIASPNVARVTIVDDDLPPQSTFSFTQPKFLVMESGGEATVSVTRTALPGGGFASPASVAYATVAGAAVAGSDFTARSGTLSWGAGESGSKSIAIPIVDDAIAEAPEAFKVRLSSPSAGASITVPETVVLIVDADEAFPPQGAMPADWTIPSGAAAGWLVSAEAGAYEGAYSLRSEAVSDGEAAQLEVAGTFAAGTVRFRVRVSSEAGFDFLRFYVDGVQAGEWSGTAVSGWQSFSVPLAAGAHTLRWSYEKDASASLGVDAAWIDDVVMPSRTP